MMKCKKIVYAREFNGEMKLDDFSVVEEQLATNLQNGEILCEAEYIGIDAGLRVYFSNLKVGDTLIGGQVAKIIDSQNPKFPTGSYVFGTFGWRSHTVINPSSKASSIELYVLPNFEGQSRSLALGALGLSGNTALYGLEEICKPKKNDVVVVSTAAGGVGSHVCQLAKIHGCRVIGLTGSDEKVKWLNKELEIDAAINYKDPNWEKLLKEAAPEGIDCYFDNVGGDISATVINSMKKFGRIAVCGSTSDYNLDLAKLPKSYHLQPVFNWKELSMEGFVVFRWADKWQEGIQTNLKYTKEGKLKNYENIVEGFENAPKALIDVLKGLNYGKTAVKV